LGEAPNAIELPAGPLGERNDALKSAYNCALRKLRGLTSPRPGGLFYGLGCFVTMVLPDFLPLRF
jgi:hypothetical protein